MSVANKLSYLGETKEEIREGLNKLGGNISKSDTFRSYADAIEDIYDSMPKVEESDVESATLDGTIKGGLTIDPKGNTKQGILPSGYTQVDYIESSGTQYIDTGYKYTANDKIEIKFVPLEANVDKALFGAYQGQNTGFCELGYYNNKLRGNISETGSPTYTTGTIYECSLINGKWNYNNSPFGAEKNITMTSNCYLFGANHSGATKLSSNRVYSLKMKRNNNVINNFIPCYRNSDNEVGLYDLVTNTFLTNAGTGTFTYGSVAPTPNAPIPINVVSGDNEIVICGNNLLNVENPFTQQGSRIIPLLLEAGSYTLSFSNWSSTLTNPNSRIEFHYEDETILTLDCNNNNKVNNLTFTKRVKEVKIYSNTTDGNSSIAIVTYNNLMLLKGTYTSETIPPYEPYQSQTYPIYLGVENYVKTPTKINNVVQSSLTLNGLTFTTLGNGEFSISGTATAQTDFNIHQSASEPLYINDDSCYLKINKLVAGLDLIISGTGNNGIPYTTLSGTTIEKAFSITDKTKPISYLIFRVANGTTINDTFKVELINGSKYNHTSTQLLELCKIGDYQDYFTKNSDGQWCKYNAIKKYTFNGSENWTTQTMANNCSYQIWLADLKPNEGNSSKTNYLVNSFIEYTPNTLWQLASGVKGFCITPATQYSSNAYVRICVGDSTDKVDDFKTLLESNNVIMYGVLKTPYLSLIEDETLISQLDNIQNAMSYLGQTNVMQNNNDLPFKLVLKAILDWRNNGGE